jgi:hypothetical protein
MKKDPKQSKEKWKEEYGTIDIQKIIRNKRDRK